MEFEDGERPIIVRKIKKGGHAHHGGAWKVAFADFAVAMMAFFLVLWLMESASVDEKKAISGYFSDPTGFTEGGSPYVIQLEGSLKDTDSSDDGGKEETMTKEEIDAKRIIVNEETVQDLAQQIERKKFKELQSTLQAKIAENPELEKYKEQILIEITEDGLQIQIVDKDSRPMFDSASNKIKSYATVILKELASTIGTLKNKISISGHTDAAIFTERKDYSNWELSSERANSARRSLVEGGVTEDKIAQVVGLSSSVLFDKDNPLNPTNRRISILVLNDLSAQRIARLQQGQASAEPPPETQQLPEDPEFQDDSIESLDIEVDDKPIRNSASESSISNSAFDQIRKTIDQRKPSSPKASSNQDEERINDRTNNRTNNNPLESETTDDDNDGEFF